jgi:hypothetical protein
MSFKLWLEGVEHRGPQGKPKKVRGPREDLYEVMEANMQHGVIVGPMWESLSRLRGGANLTDPSESGRVTKLASQISGFGGYWERPIVDEDGNVIEGQHRVSAALHLGYKKIPIMRVMDLGRFYGMEQMTQAAKAALKGRVQHPDQLTQIVTHALDILYEEKGNVQEALGYTIGRGYDDAFHAAITAANRKPLPKFVQ